MKKIKLGIVGAGFIGKYVARAILKSYTNNIQLTAIYDHEKTNLSNDAMFEKYYASSIDKVIARTDLILESASPDIVFPLVKKALNFDRQIIVMSVSGLLGYKSLANIASKSKGRIIVPSGAISGIDAIKTASLGKVKKMTLVTKKPLDGLAGAPFIKKKYIDLAKIKKETLLFEGTVREACQGFPKNINVAATLALIGIPSQKFSVRIITSPLFQKNSHQIILESDSGTICTETVNEPAKENPRTSRLAAMSAVRTVLNSSEKIVIGT